MNFLIGSSKRSFFLAGTGGTLLLASSLALASGTSAGTQINNTASATYELPGGGTGTINSNTVSLRVDELVDVTVASADGGDVSVQPGITNQVLSFTLTNSGNGSEAFQLSARNSLAGDDFDPETYAIYLDSNGDGDYDPGIDQAYVAGTNDPVLAADASATAFVVSSMPAGAIDGQRASIGLFAVATTGSGTPGTSFAGQGAGGGDAVVGASGADAEGYGYFRVSAATVSFVKSATVADQFGGTNAVPGATITYQLVATVSGSGSISNLAITDGIPVGSSFKSGSLMLDSSGLSDAADGDAGEYTAAAIAVRLGTVGAGASRTVTFQVVVQ